MPPISEDQYKLMQMRVEAGKKNQAPVSPADAVEDESELHNDIRMECLRRGWIAFHGSMAHKSKRTLGEPDFTVLADRGRVFFFEAKRKGGKLKPEQLGIKLMAEKLGTTIHTIYSMQDFLAIVDR